jgi:hypothetical protein
MNSRPDGQTQFALITRQELLPVCRARFLAPLAALTFADQNRKMNKLQLNITTISILFLLAVLFVPEGYATEEYAEKTGGECRVCHIDPLGQESQSWSHLNDDNGRNRPCFNVLQGPYINN